MSAKDNVASTGSNAIKWIFAVLLLIAGVGANYHFADVVWSLRAAGWIVLLLVFLGVAAWTTQGQSAWTFIKHAKGELLKVVWPSKQETTQMTIVVLLAVVALGLILWGIDTFFLWFIGWLTGNVGA